MENDLNPFPPKVTNVPGVGPLMLTTTGGLWIKRGRDPYTSWEYVAPWDCRYLLWRPTFSAEAPRGP